MATTAQEPGALTPGPDPGRVSGAPPAQTIVVQSPGNRGFYRFRTWLLMALLTTSVLANISMYVAWQDYFSAADGPSEKFYSGDRNADSKLAVIRISGTIMPPFTERILKSIRKAKDDEKVKGVLLSINSPGGFVTDSHQIYHRLKELSDKKPVVVSMGSMAASGGYYVAMGAGEGATIFAEPTTWTGSIGVIIPHYEVEGLAEKLGVKALPLKTGEFKDSLSPFRPMTERDKVLWENIMNQSFDQFLEVINDNRANLDLTEVRALATGQVYTAKDAKKNGLIDEIGYEEDALESLRQKTSLSTARVVRYDFPISLVDALLGSAEAQDPSAQWRALMESTVPRAMFYCSWAPLAPGAH